MRWFLGDDVLWSGGFVETKEDVLGVDKGDDAVEVDGTTEAVVDPEERGEVAGVGETAGFEHDVVEGAAAGDEGFDGCDARVSGGAFSLCGGGKRAK